MPLFRRYNAVMLATFASLLVVLVWVSLSSFDRQLERQLAGNLRESVDAAATLDHRLGASVAQVEALEQSARWFLEMGADAPEPGLLRQLATTGDAAEPHFTLTATPRLKGRPLAGGLDGLGTPQTLDAERRREVAMALHLNTHFRTVLDRVPSAAWVYYISASDFFNLYPPPEPALSFSRGVHDSAGYLSSTPALNPDGSTRWTPAYVDYGGKGLMVTCAKPVTDRGRFLGQVGLDLTLGGLNTLLRTLQPRWGTLFIVNGDGQLLAHPTLVQTGSSEEVAHARVALPEAAAGVLDWLGRLRRADRREYPEHWVFAVPLREAPWTLVAIAPKAGIHAAVIAQGRNVLAFVVLGLFIMLVVGQLVIRRDFVRPAQQLLQHIQHEARGDADPRKTASVRRAWKPWFELISSTFREKNRAQAALRQYSESLERRVQERTRDLDAQNAQLEVTLQQLRDAQQQVVSQARIASFGTLAANLAHEINNPVSAIRASCDVAQRASARLVEALQPELRTGVERPLGVLETSLSNMASATARLTDLVGRLSAFESIASSENRTIDVDQEVEQAVASQRKQLPRGVTLEVELQARQTVEAVPREIRHLAFNLIDNARKAVGATGAIRVRTFDVADAVHIEVVDDGHGMDAAQRATLFDTRFSRHDDRIGAGIGLKVVKAVTDRLGGRVEVDSRLGEGSCFTVQIPARAQARGSADAASTAGATVAGEITPPAGRDAQAQPRASRT